ncbi:MAG: hemolysin III family protein [Bacteroidaceae bacterium]|nr:hemolysin III family protein [Bacteroidaceae bacterium]
MTHFLPSKEEQGNTWTHFVGVVFALSSIWMVWPAIKTGWQMAFGVFFFIVGMFLMFLSSTIYHWLRPGMAKDILRKCDHISIYVMIACSYTPICVGVIGGWLGWLVFGFLWFVALVGSIVKIVAIGKHPKLSLAMYLIMGWSVLFIFPTVWAKLSTLSLVFLFCEGILYTVGTYFFANDKRPHYHAIWHIFVLLGAIAHWSVILTLMLY